MQLINIMEVSKAGTRPLTSSDRFRSALQKLRLQYFAIVPWRENWQYIWNEMTKNIPIHAALGVQWISADGIAKQVINE